MSHKQDGYIVLITVLVLGVMTSVIVSVLLLTGQSATITSNSVEANTGAKAAATACAELALSAIQVNPILGAPSTNTTTVDATLGETCTYTITGSSPSFSIASTGTVIQAKKTYLARLSVTTSQVTPSITISSWQDVQ
jgi:hypothetical protein